MKNSLTISKLANEIISKWGVKTCEITWAIRIRFRQSHLPDGVLFVNEMICLFVDGKSISKLANGE